MKHKKIIGLAAAAFLLAGTLSIDPALAFFTASSQATGVKTLQPLGLDTNLEEIIKKMEKIIKIRNTGASPCWVRVQVFCGENPENAGTTIAPTLTIAGTGWSEKDGWYYYDQALEAGQETNTELVVSITKPENGSDYDIIVVHECTPVMDESETAMTANWELKWDEDRLTVKEAGEA